VDAELRPTDPVIRLASRFWVDELIGHRIASLMGGLIEELLMATAQVWALNGRQKVLEPSARYGERRRCLVHRERAHYRLEICTHADISFLSLNARMNSHFSGAIVNHQTFA
jgi:hypothetical protein